MGYEHGMFCDISPFRLIPQLSCTLCKKVHSEPTETPCGHVFCNLCISTYVDKYKSCPECKNSISSTRILKYSVVMENILNPFEIQCKKCNSRINYGSLLNHKCQKQQNFSNRFSSLHTNSGSLSLGKKDEPLILDTPQQRLSSSPSVSYRNMPQQDIRVKSQPQFAFPAISSNQSSYSKQRVCRGCGGESKSNRKINAITNLCNFCEKYS